MGSALRSNGPDILTFVSQSCFAYRLNALPLPQLVQVRDMRSDRHAGFGEFDIPDAVLFAQLLDDLADRRIVYVRDRREKVVFDLEIQAADQPGDDLIFGGEVGRGLKLM